MARLAPVTPPTAKPFISSTRTTQIRCHHKVWLWASTSISESDQQTHVHVQRRNVAVGLAGVALGLSVGGGNAMGAARRAPPPPPTERQDPNVSGLAAKVLASKKRKEAMKESIAKLRGKGKPIPEPIQESVPEPTTQ